MVQQAHAAPLHHPFCSPVQMTQVALTSGSTQYNVLLSGIVGNVSSLIFVVRLQSDVQTNYLSKYNNYQAISTAGIKNAGGSFILGGVVLPAQYIVNTWMPKLFPGSTADLETPSASLSGAKNIYAFSFAEKPNDAIVFGHQTGYHYFDGLHQLQINFASTTSVNQVVDIIAYTHKNVVVSPTGIVNVQVA